MAPATPRRAATVVLLRQAPGGLEVLLTKRPATMAFAADMYVFPGGAADAADGADLRVTAIRELAEEAGVVLPDADALVPLSRWVTPPFVERRFDVAFFAAELPSGVTPSFVGDEVVEHRWLTPRDALDERTAGRMGLWVPTSATLQQLEHVTSFDEIRERLGPGPAVPSRVVEEAPDVVRVVLPSAGGVDGQPVNAYLVGRRDVVVVDPGDPSDAAAELLLDVASRRDGRIVGIVLTSAAPDHHAGAEALAGRIDVPVFAGPEAARWLPYEVDDLGDGEAVPAGDLALRVLATPGPRADSISLVGDGFAVVGDLIGPGPSRSIVGEPDLAAMRRSVDRLAGLALPRWLAGHGDVSPSPG